MDGAGLLLRRDADAVADEVGHRRRLGDLLGKVWSVNQDHVSPLGIELLGESFTAHNVDRLNAALLSELNDVTANGRVGGTLHNPLTFTEFNEIVQH